MNKCPAKPTKIKGQGGRTWKDFWRRQYNHVVTRGVTVGNDVFPVQVGLFLFVWHFYHFKGQRSIFQKMFLNKSFSILYSNLNDACPIQIRWKLRNWLYEPGRFLSFLRSGVNILKILFLRSLIFGNAVKMSYSDLKSDGSDRLPYISCALYM